MKYTKPGITREKFSLLPLAMTPDVNSIQEGPVTEEDDPFYENGLNTVSNAFGEVFDFSQK